MNEKKEDKKKKILRWNNSYFWGAIGCILIIGWFAAYSVDRYGMEKSGFILGILSAVLGSAVTYLFNMSKDKSLLEIKEKEQLEKIMLEINMNEYIIKKWIQFSENNKKEELDIVKYNGNISLNTTEIRKLNFGCISEKDKNYVYNYIKNIEFFKISNQGVGLKYIKQLKLDSDNMIKILKNN